MENKTVEMVVKDLLLADNRKKEEVGSMGVAKQQSDLKRSFFHRFIR